MKTSQWKHFDGRIENPDYIVSPDDISGNFWGHTYLVHITAHGISFLVNAEYEGTALDEIIEYVERPDAHSQCEFIDKIPELGETLANAGKKLGLLSRTYGRYRKKESIGRETLIKYIKQLFYF